MTLLPQLFNPSPSTWYTSQATNASAQRALPTAVFRAYWQAALKLARNAPPAYPKSTTLPPLSASEWRAAAPVLATLAHRRPGIAWAIFALGWVAMQTQPDSDDLQAFLAWWAAYAANEWTAFDLAQNALTHAMQVALARADLVGQALCHWQQHRAAWNNPKQAVASLQTATMILQQAQHPAFWDCQLSYIEALLYDKQLETAEALLTHCQTVFTEQAQVTKIAQTEMYFAMLYRRYHQFEKAIQLLRSASPVLAQAHLSRWWIMCRYIQLLAYMPGAQYQQLLAESHAIIQHCRRLRIERFLVDILNLQLQTFRLIGDFIAAQACLKEIIAIGGDFPPYFHLDAGLLESNLGDFNSAYKHLQLALNQYLANGHTSAVALTWMFLGKVYGNQHRYQFALYYLDSAAADLKNEPSLWWEHQIFTAEVWLLARQPQRSLELLDRLVSDPYLQQNRLARAEYQFVRQVAIMQLQPIDPIQLIAKIEQLAVEFTGFADLQVDWLVTGAQFLYNSDPQKTIELLIQACDFYQRAGLQANLALAWLLRGQAEQARAALSAAQAAFEQASQLAFNRNWQTYGIAQAQLAKLATDTAQVTQYYNQAFYANHQILRESWQPHLWSGFLPTAQDWLAQALQFAITHQMPMTGFLWLAAGQARVLANRLKLGNTTFDIDTLQQQELDSLRQQLQHDYHPDKPDWQQKYANYQSKLSHWLTQQHTQQRHQTGIQQFEPTVGFESIVELRSWLTDQFGLNWAVAQYFQQNQQLFITWLTPTECHLSQILLSLGALQNIQQQQDARQPLPAAALAILGKLLFPVALQTVLTPDTQLLICPHQGLNNLPWAALRLQTRHLVECCTPIIVPSLSVLRLLIARATSHTTTGLILGVPEFNGRHPTLPAVATECAALASAVPATVLPADCTWQQLQNALQDQRPAFWHIASHTFWDSATGLTGGIALQQQDIWLPQIETLAYVPQLVSFASCGSLKSHLLAGNEPISLAASLLQGGAKHVVGSLYVLADNPELAELGQLFYQAYQAGRPPAQALAHAQRTLLQQPNRKDWQGFLCFGT